LTVASPDDEVLWARALVKSYDGSPALRGVSIGVREGEILAVTGPRGCGKSTLLGCLSGQLLPDDGEVWFEGKPLHTLGRSRRDRIRRDRFGWIGTEPQLVPELTAQENAALPLLLGGASRKAARSAALEWLERLDVAECAGKRPGELLQAQRQRVAVARALASRPAVIFADEPTAPLHLADGALVLRVLTAASRSHGITIVLATGDDEIASFADRRVPLADGLRTDEPVLTALAETVAATGILHGALGAGPMGTGVREIAAASAPGPESREDAHAAAADGGAVGTGTVGTGAAGTGAVEVEADHVAAGETGELTGSGSAAAPGTGAAQQQAAQQETAEQAAVLTEERDPADREGEGTGQQAKELGKAPMSRQGPALEPASSSATGLEGANRCSASA
jgi:putative ABC transport system ATP-binding protein